MIYDIIPTDEYIGVSAQYRLGNILFQIAAGLSLSLTYNKPLFIIPNSYGKYWEYLKSFSTSILSQINMAKDSTNNFSWYIDNFFNFKEIKYKKNIILKGFFWSENYFKNYKTEIINTFKPNDEILNIIYNLYGDLSNYTSVQIRRTDFLNGNQMFIALNENYYKKAMNYIGKNEKFIILSDDIEWCKNKFSDYDAIYDNSINDIISFYIQTICKNNIISSSTFGWWGAYLNSNKNKIIVAPELFSRITDINNIIYPNTWIKQEIKKTELII